MKRIQLTPTELKSQASEMTSLMGEYESLFGSVTDILNDTNNHWSTNLSHNFAGKITSAQKGFSTVIDMLQYGATAANSSAESFESIDAILAKNTDNNQAKVDVYGSSVKKGAAANSGVKDNKLIDKIKDMYIGTAEVIVTTTQNVISTTKKSYEEKGWAYDIVQYGKCALKVASATVKIVGSVGAIASGVGVPIAICGIISAGNDIINACNDATYVYTNQHDKVGTTNLLKDTLVHNMGDIGGMLGYREAGEFVGNVIYTGLDVVSFLNGADKMLKSLGKVNTVVTGSTGYSKVWGWTKYEDVMDNKLNFSLEMDYFIRKLMKVDPSSDLNIVYEGVKNIYSSLKSAWKLGKEFANL